MHALNTQIMGEVSCNIIIANQERGQFSEIQTSKETDVISNIILLFLLHNKNTSMTYQYSVSKGVISKFILFFLLHNATKTRE